jgi:hypothetical protein
MRTRFRAGDRHETLRSSAVMHSSGNVAKVGRTHNRREQHGFPSARPRPTLDHHQRFDIL